MIEQDNPTEDARRMVHGQSPKSFDRDCLLRERMTMVQVKMNRSADSIRLRIGIAGLGLFGVGLAVFLSIKSSPNMSVVRWLPHFITAWADQHGRLCNFPAYGLLAISFLAIAKDRWQRTGVTISLALLVAGLEIVQLWIPSRVADKWDIFWGCAGLVTSWAAFEVMLLLLRKIAVRVKSQP
jgi:hypothetical protein